MSEETDTKIMTDKDKREQLRQKIAAGEKRNADRSLADRARDAADSATEFVKANPIKSVAGVALVALLIGAMTRPGRRLGRKTGAMAAVATDAAIAYGLSLLDAAGDAARAGQDKLEDFGDSVGTTARGLRRKASYQADATSDAARTAARRTGRKAGRSIRDLRARLTH